MSLTVRSALVGLAFLAMLCPPSLSGCKGGPDDLPRPNPDVYPDDPIERAKRISRLRADAKKWWEAFVRSEGRSEGPDIEALERCAELYGEVAKVDPTACPNCYLDYGAALSRLGLYYETLVVAMRAQLESAEGRDRDELRQKTDGYVEVYKDYYRQSNRQFDIYLRSFPGPIQPKVYEWLINQCKALEDWDRALYYLSYFERDVALNDEGKKTVVRERKLLEHNLRLQREREAEATLRGGDLPN
jgi:hypothetical protein